MLIELIEADINRLVASRLLILFRYQTNLLDHSISGFATYLYARLETLFYSCLLTSEAPL